MLDVNLKTCEMIPSFFKILLEHTSKKHKKQKSKGHCCGAVALGSDVFKNPLGNL